MKTVQPEAHATNHRGRQIPDPDKGKVPVQEWPRRRLALCAVRLIEATEALEEARVAGKTRNKTLEYRVTAAGRALAEEYARLIEAKEAHESLVECLRGLGRVKQMLGSPDN